MSDFKKINLFEHAQKRLFAGTLSVDDFKIIVDECSKNPLDIISQKIKQMGEAAITELKIRQQRKERGLPTFAELCEMDKAAENVLID